MNKRIISSPHKHEAASIRQLMQQVILALVPGLLVYVWLAGSGIIIQCILAVTFAVTIEAWMLKLRGLPIKVFLNDLSAVLTGLLFALCLSPFTPWWINFFGIAFAIIVAKHVFGGLGNNLFNPAIAGYIFVLVSFPEEMLHWPALDKLDEGSIRLADTFSYIFLGLSHNSVDAISSATPLNFLRAELSNMAMISEIEDAPLFGRVGGYGWEYISLAFLAGGIWLIIKDVIKWHIPTTVIASLFVMALVFHWYDPDIYASPFFHVFSGATILTAFFIATDPVSSCSTVKGKIYFAIGIGVIAYIIRNWGAYPDGFAFAVLLMNSAAPWLDSQTRPAVLGEEHG